MRFPLVVNFTDSDSRWFRGSMRKLFGKIKGSEYAAPMELEFDLGSGVYKDVAPMELGFGSSGAGGVLSIV